MQQGVVAANYRCMTEISHQGHLRLGDVQLGATLNLKPGNVTLDVASPGAMPNMPDRIELVQFTSNTGYFTLINLLRLNHNMRLGVAGLSNYTCALAFENAHFQSQEEIRSQTWSFHIGDVAKILHVNGVIKQIILPDAGGVIINYTISSPSPVTLECPDAGIALSLGQNIRTSGDNINGPIVELTYPATITFPDEVGVDSALTCMHRIRQLFSLIMGRVLPITNASLQMPTDSNPHEVGIVGLRLTDDADKPSNPLISNITADRLAPMLNLWLSKYEDLEDAIRLHMSGLEQRRLPSELRFQIFVQALEALHRRTAIAASHPIDSAPILSTLRGHNIPNDVVDRVGGVLAHAHEPGLRQWLGKYWDLFATEIAILRPAAGRRAFIGRIAATRNHYAHRTDRDGQVLSGIDLWDATEAVKAISHMALLREFDLNTNGIASIMLDSRFVDFSVDD